MYVYLNADGFGETREHFAAHDVRIDGALVRHGRPVAQYGAGVQ